ncbi:HAD family hydrolase [Actinomadura rupiterrae]|uniref:HAD family hydrolase n=1 Tax=Actinomadura rupiterrae TaxID=559627 RepID=UPI0020A2BA6D|nr:HAD family hydrolase [Actinomadura rupiterrae]MCP2337127.1 phosphoglycolate phosphatase [Actinomadura rupiterrae]
MPYLEPFAIGFDLDLTLADTRTAIAAVYRALSEETGVPIDTAAVVRRIGPPLEEEIGYWYPPERVPEMVARYRAVYPEIAIPATVAMDGAREALDAVRQLGGRVVVVSGKNQADTERTVRHLDFPVDAVVGGLFGMDKGVALREHRAVAYVGDHPGDVDAARAAEITSIGVATGGFDAAALTDYGADIVLPDLRAFPDWLTRRYAGRYPNGHPEGRPEGYSDAVPDVRR